MERSNSFSRFQQAANRQLCPECGASMTMVDRRREGSALFVWYSCSRNGCSGQWLEKASNTSPSNIKKAV